MLELNEEILLKVIEIQTIAMLANVQRVIDDDSLTDTERVEKIKYVLTQMPDISGITVNAE